LSTVNIDCNQTQNRNIQAPRSYTLRIIDGGVSDNYPANELRIGDVVRVGTPLGKTGAVDSNPATADFDHLHLEMWLARGYLQPRQDQPPRSEDDHSLNINPFLLYSNTTLNVSVGPDGTHLQGYFPEDLNQPGRPVSFSSGLTIGQLTEWSLGGLNFRYQNESFYKTLEQNSNNSEVEWSPGMYPLAVQPLTINQLVVMLSSQYGQVPYIPIDCPLYSSDNPNLNQLLPFLIFEGPNGAYPLRQVAVCAMPDLHNESPYPA
jgi:hypothetical protein